MLPSTAPLAVCGPQGAPQAALARVDGRGRIKVLDPNLIWDPAAVGVPLPETELTEVERTYAQDNPYGRWVTLKGGRRVYLRGSASMQQRKEYALRTHKPSSADKHHAAYAQELRVAAMINAKVLGDNEPMDVVGVVGGRRYGVEVKAFLDQSASKVTMHPESLARKLRWARKEKATLHTVVVDARRDFRGGRHAADYSGHELWYRAGVGSFRLAGMTQVRDAAHLRALMRGEGQYAEYHLPGDHDQDTHGRRGVDVKGALKVIEALPRLPRRGDFVMPPFSVDESVDEALLFGRPTKTAVVNVAGLHAIQDGVDRGHVRHLIKTWPRDPRIMPPVVRWEKGLGYVIIDGTHTLAAAKWLGVKTFLVLVDGPGEG